MTSGMPDYLRGMRLKHGAPMESAGSKAVASLGYTTLLTVSGKGIIYGGLVFLNHTSSQKSSEVILELDGDRMISMSFTDMNLLGIDVFGIYPQMLRKFDDVNFIYSVGLCYGVTFETSLKVIYNELHGSDPTVFSQLMYAIV